jgi:predicted HTH transcriptional regulator
LIDYKRDIPETTGEFLKLIKQIQAFHNTYGGYLIYGAEEVKKDTIIIPKYKSIKELDAKNFEIYVVNFYQLRLKYKL